MAYGNSNWVFNYFLLIQLQKHYKVWNTRRAVVREADNHTQDAWGTAPELDLVHEERLRQSLDLEIMPYMTPV